MFSQVATRQWIPARADSGTRERPLVTVDPTLGEIPSVSLMHAHEGPTVLALSPASATALGLADGEHVDDSELRRRLDGAGLTLEDTVNVYYLTPGEQRAVRDEPQDSTTRQLTSEDADVFNALIGKAPAADVEEAYVELDHWLVYGVFAGDELAAVGSMYPEDGAKIADLGVLTLPEHRGKGLGRAIVRAMSAAALELGYEPQYRCEHDNAPSVALARGAGFTLFGEWESLDDD